MMRLHLGVFEAYYALSTFRGLWLSLDGQMIIHPGYNTDRGPVAFGSIRLHAEF
jgi:hypothetical protein